MDYDILVIGGGIGGMEAALKLGDMGYRVLLVEKEASIGGKIILLSKVFPTLDCASCISTPKMAGSVNHPNIQVMVYSEVEEVQRQESGRFTARIRQKPTFVDPAACTGCRQCETNCSVAVPDQFNFNLGSRRAAYLAFPQAVPQKAVIEREGTSPCTGRCPAGIKAHGYVALVRAGKYREAFDLILEATPLVGSLGRACYAPCEAGCTRGALEGPVPVRRLKRFVAERRYREPVGAPAVAAKGGPAVAVVGAGPAGLTCAFQLAKKGYRVKIFEAAPQAGGMLSQAIPGYRLPREAVARDIQNVTALGVEMETNVRVHNLAGLKEKAGFDAVFVACGTPRSKALGVPGEDLDGVLGAMDFLGRAEAGDGMSGRTVLVTGGGNVAIDSARVARRQGAARVTVVYRRDRQAIRAHAWEIEAAEREGVEFIYQAAPVAFTGQAGKLAAVECTRMEPGGAGSSGRPLPVAGSRFSLACDLAVVAVGLSPETEAFRELLPLNAGGFITADRETLQTAVPYIFAGGDVVTGPSMIVEAAGQGRRAAFYIDCYLRGAELAGFDDPLPVVDREQVVARQKTYRRLPPVAGTQAEEPPLTEEEARYSAGRCLDCGVCAECHQCVAVCPAHAVHLEMREEVRTVQAGAVIMATGFQLFDAREKPQYGYGKYPNVVSGMQMDRLLAPTRPYNAVLRPSDGKVPDNIAFVLCTGSRDQSVDNPLCSRVCCMYSVKHNQLIMGALPLADVTVYYMDIRAFGKGYEEFYNQAAAMGTRFVQGRVAGIRESAGGNLVVSYEDIAGGGGPQQQEHDLVVLATGLLPNSGACGICSDLALDQFAYIQEVEEDLSPGKTSIDGVFVAGSASQPRDIPDTIVHAGAAAAGAAAYVERTGRKQTGTEG